MAPLPALGHHHLFKVTIRGGSKMFDLVKEDGRFYVHLVLREVYGRFFTCETKGDYTVVQ